MKQTSWAFKVFTIMEFEEEGEYLREQQKKGWKLTAIRFPGIYYFVRCDAMDVVYQLDYNQEGRAHKDTYVQMFKDCGWEYLFDYVGYSYFRKNATEMKHDESIYCDNTSRLDMIRRIFKTRMIPLLFFFFLVILPNLFLHFDEKFSFMFIASLVLLVVYGLVFTNFTLGYIQFKRR
ncbi:MAG: DUF2812 domain-containing protein [Spirochaetia bacterium]|nr:DUF2812 domain-containing protein [Spirochaetia bacterium]